LLLLLLLLLEDEVVDVVDTVTVTLESGVAHPQRLADVSL